MSTLTIHWGETLLTVPAEPGQNLLEVLAKNEIPVYAPCKGNGACKKCRVTWKTGEGTAQVLACETRLEGDGEVWVPRVTGGGLTEYAPNRWEAGLSGTGAAVDIGTTTVAVALIALDTGKTLASRAILNPQQVCGADVISRIAACGEGKLELQTRLIRKAVAGLLEELCRAQGVTGLQAATVCGNTTMLHLFCGVDPTPIGTAPFTPVFTEMKTYAGAELGLPAERVYVLPSASGYIGSDIVCGIVSQGLDKGEPALLADLGTNGELALFTGERLICASTAAGPALEGANIECGTGGVPGAICGVAWEHGQLKLRTIGDLPPTGICGSGLVDLIALLLKREVIDESGSFQGDDPHLRGGRYWLTDQVWLSQKDVRQFQLAKAAISAGIETLCRYGGLAPEKIKTLLIAGGLGFYLREDSALETGLIPGAFGGKLRVVGNSGLAGAVACLGPAARQAAGETARTIQICELSSSPDLSDRFIDGMSFEN